MDGDIWETGGIFDNEEVLHEHWTPEKIPERAAERKEIVRGLRRVFRGTAPKNMFLQGKPGQGKTATAKNVLNVFEERAAQEDIEVETIYVSCANHKSSYKIACDIVERHTGENPHGHGQKKVFDKMFEVFEGMAENVIVVLDEIDKVGKKNDILYNIPRARDNGDVTDTKLGIIGVTNDSTFLSNLDSDVQSSLYDSTIQFDAYDANKLTDILERRADKAFVDGVIEESAIKLCAALAAQDKGSARQAIEYLYEAGEIAVDEGANVVTEAHAREAEEEVEKRYITQSIDGLTTQDQLSLAAVVSVAVDGDEPARTRRIYAPYKDLTDIADVNTLAFDRVRLHLHDLESLGLIDGQKRSGDSQGGEKYYWNLATDLGTTIDVLDSVDRFDELVMDRIFDEAENESLSKTN